MLVPLTEDKVEIGMKVYGTQNFYHYLAIVDRTAPTGIIVRRTESSEGESWPIELNDQWLCTLLYRGDIQTGQRYFGANGDYGTLFREATEEESQAIMEKQQAHKNKEKPKKSELVLLTTENISQNLRIYTQSKSPSLNGLTTGLVTKWQYGTRRATIQRFAEDFKQTEYFIPDKIEAVWPFIEDDLNSELQEIQNIHLTAGRIEDIYFSETFHCFTLQTHNIRLYIRKSDLPKPGRHICFGCKKRGAKVSQGYCSTCSKKPF